MVQQLKQQTLMCYSKPTKQTNVEIQTVTHFTLYQVHFTEDWSLEDINFGYNFEPSVTRLSLVYIWIITQVKGGLFVLCMLQIYQSLMVNGTINEACKLAKILFHEFYKHSFWYVRIDALWKNMVPYNCSPITYIRFCQVTFNNWNMKMITLPNTDCSFLNSGVIIRAKSDVHAIGKDQWSKVKVSEVKTQLSRLRSLTPVWIHI